MKHFGVACVDCNKRRQFAWNTHMHIGEEGLLFKCFSCGREELLVPDVSEMPDEQTREKLLEKKKIEEELERLSKEKRSSN